MFELNEIRGNMDLEFGWPTASYDRDFTGVGLDDTTTQEQADTLALGRSNRVLTSNAFVEDNFFLGVRHPNSPILHGHKQSSFVLATSRDNHLEGFVLEAIFNCVGKQVEKDLDEHFNVNSYNGHRVIHDDASGLE